MTDLWAYCLIQLGVVAVSALATLAVLRLRDWWQS